MYFVKHYHCVPPTYGGVSVFVKRLMLSLCKQGLISGAFKGKTYDGIPSELDHLLDDFPKHSRSLFVLPEFWRLYIVFKDYQLIHAHTTLSTVFGIWLLHKLQHKPVVYTVHNQMIDREYSFLNAIDRYCVRSLAADNKVQFITVNENGKKALLDRGLKFANEVVVLPAYIPPIEIGNPFDYLSEELVSFSQQNKPLLLFYAESFAVSSGKDIYGTGTIVELFVALKHYYPNLQLIFCMANINEDQNKLNVLKQKILDAGCQADVFWQIGAVSEMWPLLKASTALVRPTITDGDSIMIREALAYGLPVITSDVTARPRGCVIYKSEDFQDLLEKTISFLSAPYREAYPQTNHTNDMIAIYNNLLSERHV